MISYWSTFFAPWRMAVPTQSEPVSPPPTTRTTLSLALMILVLTISPDEAVGKGQEVHGVLDAAQLAPRTARSRGWTGAHGQQDHVVGAAQVARRDVLPDDHPVSNRTPSSSIWRMRRSMMFFSILNSGMP